MNPFTEKEITGRIFVDRKSTDTIIWESHKLAESNGNPNASGVYSISAIRMLCEIVQVWDARITRKLFRKHFYFIAKSQAAGLRSLLIAPTARSYRNYTKFLLQLGYIRRIDTNPATHEIRMELNPKIISWIKPGKNKAS